MVCKKLQRIITPILTGCLFFSLCIQTAYAKKVVYSPHVEQGEKEVEYYIDWREDATGKDSVTHEAAFEYGFTDVDRVALYLIQKNQPAEDVTTSYKVEWVHQLVKQEDYDYSAGLYLEYFARTDSPDTIEFKPLIEKSWAEKKLTFIFNGVFEREVGTGSNSGVDLGYAARAVWNPKGTIRPAIEIFGSFGAIGDFKNTDKQSHLIGPVIDFKLGHALKLQLGSLIGLTDGSEDVRLKSNLSFEWD